MVTVDVDVAMKLYHAVLPPGDPEQSSGSPASVLAKTVFLLSL
jgi:hypothetical protein